MIILEALLTEAFLAFFCWLFGYLVANLHPPEWYFDDPSECDPEPEEPPLKMDIDIRNLKRLNLQSLTVDEISKLQKSILKLYGLEEAGAEE